MKYDTLYKRTSTGAVQVWWMEIEGSKYRTISGKKDGKLVTSEWTLAEPKNVGRSNETTGEEQAIFEVKSIYTKKEEQNGYFYSESEIDEDRGFFEPMLAKPFEPERLVEGESFFIQPKHNGVRCVGRVSGLWSRKGKLFVNCPHIEDELRPIFTEHPNLVIDGELYNHDYKSDFEKLVSSIKKQKPTVATIKLASEVVQYHIYDIYDPAKPNMKFSERTAFIEELFGKILAETKVIRRSPTWSSSEETAIHGLHKRNLKLGYEGTMVRLDRPYENKRTYSLMKYKDFKDAEFEILNVEAGKGNWSDAAKIVTLKLPDGREFGAGVKGNKEYARKLLAERYAHIGKLGTVVFFDYTAEGIPLFPIFHGVRDYE